MNPVNTLSAAFIASYPPRKCGIGTFTNDLVQSLRQVTAEQRPREDHLQVVAMNNLPQGYKFPPEVHFVIQEKSRSDYREAADFLNLSTVDVVNLQHEYGIFGGPDGNHILHLLKHVKKPVVTTLHTVLEHPTPGQKKTMEALLEQSTLVVVLAEKAVELLKRVHQYPEKRITLIPHGAPDVPFLDTSFYKDRFHAEDRRVLMTFGLLSPNKGIEVALDALPGIVRHFPDVLYIVLGATHPNVKRDSGEMYRMTLERRVQDLGLEDHVIFHNHFVTLERLVQFLVATDIYITPYLTPEQISSGTLAYAFACGKAIVSTPYWYAQELLAEARGLIVPFEDSKAIEENVLTLFSDENKLNRMRKKAYQAGRRMIWEEVAKAYDAVFERAVNEYGRKRITMRKGPPASAQSSLPEVNLDHLLMLTDDTGILQHASYRTPSRIDGYATDDNARALMVAVMQWDITHEAAILKLLHTYLAFINYAMNPLHNRVHNFMSYRRDWLDEVGSEDCHGRVLWSLGFTLAEAPTKAVLSLANQLFKQGLKVASTFSSPRAWAYTILGCNYYLRRFSGDTECKHMVETLGRQLSALYKRNHEKAWKWFEPILTYANARLPQGLITAGHYLADEAMVKQGLESLTWLLRVQTSEQGRHLSLIGNIGWYKKDGHRAQFDQQPVDALGLLEACNLAYRVTGDRHWALDMDRAFAWFLGKNDKNECLYDFSTGGCYDGLQRGGVNLNMGAESTLSWLAALHWMYRIAHQQEPLPQNVEPMAEKV